MTSNGAKPRSKHSLQLASRPWGGTVDSDDIFTSSFLSQRNKRANQAVNVGLIIF